MLADSHYLIAKEYAEKRKEKATLYRGLFITSVLSLAVIFLDSFSGMEIFSNRAIFFFLLLCLSYLFYKKWQYLSKAKIITAQLPTGEILVGSEKIKFRVGGGKLSDKIKQFFEEM